MTDCSLEPMDITKFWVSSLEMLCQVFTAATLSCCLSFCMPSVLSSITEKHALLDWDQVTDWHWRIFHFFAFKKSWVAFVVCLGSLSICTVKHASYRFCSIWLNVSRGYSLKDLRIHPATSVSSYIINKHQWARSIGSHTCPCYNTATSMFDTWCGVLWIMSCSFLSPYFSLPISLVQVNYGFISLKNCIPEHGMLFLQPQIRKSWDSMENANKKRK